MSALAVAIPAVDSALIAYAESRKDFVAFIHTPPGVSGSMAIAYRNGTTPYSHTPYNSWRAICTTGGLNVNHPVTGSRIDITEAADVLAAFATKDQRVGEWAVAAGASDGLIRSANGVLYDLGNPSRKVEGDAVIEAGIIPVVQKQNAGILIYGTRTLTKANSLLREANVADLVLFLSRKFEEYAAAVLFKPNDPLTWSSLHNIVSPFLDDLVASRAIRNYKYEGDQDVSDADQVKINNINDINSGIYLVRVSVRPIASLQYLGIAVRITSSDVSVDVQ